MERRLSVYFSLSLFLSTSSPTNEKTNLQVIAAVYGPRVPPGRPSGTAASSAAEIRVEFSIAEFAAAAGGGGGGGGKRRGGAAGGPGGASAEQRAVGSGGRDRRAGEAAQALRDALEATVLASLHPRSRIDVCVQVLAADGGWLAAAVNAASAALADAGVPCADLLAAATATSLPGCGDQALLDPSHAEECGDGVLVTVGVHSGAASRSARIEGGGGGGGEASSLPSNCSSDGDIAMLFSERRCPLDVLERTAEAAARGAAAAAAVIRSALLDASAVAVAARGG